MKITRKSFQAFFTRASFAGLLLAGGVVAAQAQTSGSLTGTTTTYNYSTAPWVITGGTGTYPDGGGVATFNPILGSTPGTVGPTSTITLDVSPTLSQINFTSPIQYILASGTGQTLNAATTGLTVNSSGTAQNVFVNGIGISIAFGSQITGVISGGGTAGLTKTGTGNLYINPAAANTYTGGTHFNGGFTTVGGTAAIGDAALGATGAGNGLSFNGGSALFAITGGLTTARDVFIDAGGAGIVTNTATTFNGVVSGSGTLTLSALNASALTLTNANTFTGTTVVRSVNSNSSGAASLVLSGNGSLAAGSAYDFSSTVTLDNSGTNNTNRLSDTAPMTLRGVNFISTGNATAASSETVGAVTANNGFSTLLVTPGTGQTNSLTLASLTRANNSTLDFRGAGLGSAPGTAGASNIFVTAAPALTGGGGAAGTTTQSIIPYAIGNLGTTTTFTAAGQVGSSFVTYDATNGIRPLATTEYATALGVNPLDNVRLTAATAAPAASVANSVLFAPAAAATLSGGPITITSGAFLYSPTANVTGTVSAGLNFGAAEGIITNTSLLTISGVITGTNGLTLSTTYAPTNNYTPNLTLTGANTYTGNTTINAGAIGVTGTVGGTSGAFGTNGTVILNGGTILASIVPTAGATTFNNNISSIGLGANYISPSSSATTSVFNGNISLTNNLNIEGYTNAAASGMTFNGVISGTGSLTDAGYSYVTINGNNTYSGGTILSGASASTFLLGSDTAFGTGTIYVNAATATLQGVGTAARTLANALFLNNTLLTGGAAPLTFTGAVNLNGSRTMAIGNAALTTFTGAISSGSLTKTGTGAVAFNSATGNTYTGGFVNTVTAANASAIYANNTSGSAFGTGAVSIGAASATVYSTLSGSFSTSGATSIAGRLSPGNGTGLTPATAGTGSIGQINFGSSLALSSATTSSLYMEIGGNNASGNFDQITVAGTFTLNGTVFIATTNGYTIQAGDSYVLATAGTLTAGTVTFNTANATLGAGVTLTETFANNQLVVTAVPEPGTWAAVALGLGALGGLQFARRRRQA